MKFQLKTICLVLMSILMTGFFSFVVEVLAKTTNPEPARVTTYGIKDATPTSVKLRGYISNHGGCPDMYTWFEYGENSLYGNETNPEYKNGIGYFSDDIYDLEPCKTYHFRAVARNYTLEESYGSDRTFTTKCASFDVNMSVKNLSMGDTIWYNSRTAESGDELLFRIRANATGDVLVKNVIVSAELPNAISYENNLEIDDESIGINIVKGAYNIEKLFPGQVKVITFEAKVGPEQSLLSGKNNLIATALLYNTQKSAQDTAKVVVTRKGVAGASTVAGATQVNTGVAGDVFNSLLPPLVLAFILVWILKSKLVGFDEWAQKRLEKAEQFRAKKKLENRADWTQPTNNKPKWSKLK